MKDYHFQENDQDFGLTVRLDDINEKVKQFQKETAGMNWAMPMPS